MLAANHHNSVTMNQSFNWAQIAMSLSSRPTSRAAGKEGRLATDHPATHPRLRRAGAWAQASFARRSPSREVRNPSRVPRCIVGRCHLGGLREPRWGYSLSLWIPSTTCQVATMVRSTSVSLRRFSGTTKCS